MRAQAGRQQFEATAEQRGGYQYWLASNVLEFTSEAYSTTLYNNDNQPVQLPGYRVDAVNDTNYSYWHSASFSNDGNRA